MRCMKLPLPVRLSLSAAICAAAYIITRCALGGVWVTVFAGSLLATGAIAAWRGRTWGVGLTLLAGTSFVGAWALDMAPSWFVAIGATGIVPFLLTWRPMARVDRQATHLFALLASLGGLACAVGWHEVGYWVVTHLYP